MTKTSASISSIAFQDIVVYQTVVHKSPNNARYGLKESYNGFLRAYTLNEGRGLQCLFVFSTGYSGSSA